MTDELAAAVEGLRADAAKLVRQRIRWAVAILTAILLAFALTVAGGLFYLHAVFCSFYLDLQPPAGTPAPPSEYGQRILHDARSTADRLHC